MSRSNIADSDECTLVGELGMLPLLTSLLALLLLVPVGIEVRDVTWRRSW